MTDETQKLFNAPWIVYGEPDDYSFVIQNASEDEIATVFILDEAKRLARLPELYDALLDEIRAKCNTCIHDNIQLGNVPFVINFNTIQNGCPFKDRQCHTVKHIEIIQKVRDGE